MENPLAIFSQLRSIINGVSLKLIHPLWKIWNVPSLKNTPHILILKVGVSFDHDVSLCFVSLLALQTCWAMFQAKNNIRSAPASSALTLVLQQSHKTYTTNHHQRSSGERNEAQRRTKVSFGRTMMQALELLRLAKRYVSG